jgi:hypothetical protein
MISKVGNMKYSWIYRICAHRIWCELRPPPPAKARRIFGKGPL